MQVSRAWMQKERFGSILQQDVVGEVSTFLLFFEVTTMRLLVCGGVTQAYKRA